MKQIRLYGRGGQGAFTASKILGAAALLDGNFALAFPSFGPERRGAPVNAYTKIDAVPVADRSQPEQFDYILVLDETLYQDSFKELLTRNGCIYMNGKERNEDQLFAVDAGKTARAILGKNIVNTALLAYFVHKTKIVSNESFLLALKDFLPKGILDKNIRLVEEIGGLVDEED